MAVQSNFAKSQDTLFTLASGRLVHEAESQHELLIAAAIGTRAKQSASAKTLLIF